MTRANNGRDDPGARMRRILEEHGDPAPYGPQHEALHALLVEELTAWLNPGGHAGPPGPDEIDQIAEIVAWEIEAAFPVGPQRTPEEWWQDLRERQAAKLAKGASE